MVEFPSWQAEIRKAQAAQAIINAKDEIELEKARQARRATEGAKLADALNLLGVTDFPALTDNELEQDGYRFSVAVSGEEAYQRHNNKASEEVITFLLHVRRDAPKDFDLEDYWPCYRSLFVYWRPVAGDWTSERAELADILDNLDTLYAEQMERLAQNRKESMSNRTAKNLTPDEQLLTALKVFMLAYTRELMAE